MNKNAFIVSVVLLVAIHFAGCSDSNDNNNPINDETGELEFTHDTKDVSVIFQLQNENGEETNIFKEGENIVFRLEIKNSGSETVVLPSQHELIGNNIFRVFSHADHKDMGTPWDPESGIYSTLLPHTLLSPNSSKVYLCPWLNKSETSLPLGSYPYFKPNGTKPLPAGNYYSEFEIKLGNTHKVTCKCASSG